MTVNEIEAAMKAQAARFNGLGALVKFDFGDQGAVYVDGTTTPAGVSQTGGEPKCTLKISLDDFVKLQKGDLNPMMAFTMGKLKIHGDMGVAMKLSSMLDD